MSIKQKIKVMHVAECIGGVDRYLHSLIKYMNHDKFENGMVLSKLYADKDYEKLADYVEIIDIPHGMGGRTIASAIDIRRLIRKHNPDVVYAHSSIAGAVTRLACLGLDVKVIYNPHGWSFNMDGAKKWMYVTLEKLMAHFCDAIICISEAEKVSALRERICEAEKLNVIYNGIDIDEYKQEDIELDIPKDAFVVGMVGRICRQKAPDIFVKMAGEVQKKIPNAYFLIVGDIIESAAREKRDIVNLARELGVNLLITGWVDNPLSYIRRFDVGCLFSRWEGFGLAIPEYMFVGVPVVATKVDAIPYLITDGIDGFLIEKDDWKQAAEKVIELRQDKIKSKEMIENGQKKVREWFDARRVSKDCEYLYGELLK